MAHSETRGWGKCDCCGGAVAVKENRSDLAYYRCDHCGVEVRHHWHKTSGKVLQQFAAPAAPEEGGTVVEKRSESPAKKPGSMAELLGLK